MILSEESQIRTLENNSIKNFILKIDLIPGAGQCFTDIIAQIADLFDRTEKRQIDGFAFDFNTSGSSTLKRTQDYDYVLVSEKNKITLTFSTTLNSFWLESSSYKDSSVYKSTISATVNAFRSVRPGVKSIRIGMRFVNEFKCEKINDIRKLLKRVNAGMVISLLSDSNLSRALAYQEFNTDGEKTRLQYGIVNRFYPAVISSYDTIIDIDSYYDFQIGIDDWEDKIAQLNHTDYNYFIKVLNPNYLDKLK